jgi:Ca2+-binding RTX toxin-like protein
VRRTTVSPGTFWWGLCRGVRTRAVSVAVATLTGLLVAPTSASGVDVTCQGRPATIVADPDVSETQGTEGDDVIVGHGRVGIRALGGNDVICLDAGIVEAGDGDDSVLVTGTKAYHSVSATLGAGDDRFVGGPRSDEVDFFDVSPGSDNISTGAGEDAVSSGDPGQPNRDVIDLGPGRDQLLLALPAGSQVRAQAGNQTLDELIFQGDRADFGFDLGTGVVTRAGVAVASLLGFGRWQLGTERHGALRVLGTPGPDTVDVAAERIDLDLGDGRDRAVVSIHEVWPARDVSKAKQFSSVIDLGPGKDYVRTFAWRVLVGDLARGRLVLRTSSRRHTTLALLGVEQFLGGAARVVLRGGPEANQLAGFGCDVRLRGGAGADRLRVLTSEDPECGAFITGDAGPDRLFGSSADDRLLGGAGRDEALGGHGTDTCRAEREKYCER